mgnify:CR=1 FL=1
MLNELSIMQLIGDASVFVKIIMLILCLMMLVSIFITCKKAVLFSRLNRKTRQFEKAFWNSGTNLQNLFANYETQDTEGIESVFVNGFYEFSQFLESDLIGSDKAVQNCQRAMEATIIREAAKQEKYLGILATFASSAPYIGLLGTVYGIMNSFMALGAAQQSSINSVAPGIAEALIATAIGLMAAIISVLSYNAYMALSEKKIVEYDAFREEFSNILQRQQLQLRAHLKRR